MEPNSHDQHRRRNPPHLPHPDPQLARADRVVFDTDGRRFAEQSGCRMATSTKNARREEHFDVDGLGRLG
jgi:hypothetical protein